MVCLLGMVPSLIRVGLVGVFVDGSMGIGGASVAIPGEFVLKVTTLPVLVPKMSFGSVGCVVTGVDACLAAPRTTVEHVAVAFEGGERLEVCWCLNVKTLVKSVRRWW